LGRFTAGIADAQLVIDQLTCTVVVYLTGGAASGATSFYGLTCLVGAALSGSRGAVIAAVTGAFFYVAMSLGLQQGSIAAPLDQPVALYRLGAADFRFYLAVNLFAILLVALLAG